MAWAAITAMVSWETVLCNINLSCAHGLRGMAPVGPHGIGHPLLGKEPIRLDDQAIEASLGTATINVPERQRKGDHA